MLMFYLHLLYDITVDFVQRHKVEIAGVGGAGVTVIARYMEFLGWAGQTLAGTGGLVVLGLTIYIKFKQAQSIYKNGTGKKDSDSI